MGSTKAVLVVSHGIDVLIGEVVFLGASLFRFGSHDVVFLVFLGSIGGQAPMVGDRAIFPGETGQTTTRD